MQKVTLFLIVITYSCLAQLPHAPVPLQNIGNICYMNATLQCMYQITPLTHFMLKQGESYYKPKSVADEYVNLIKKIQGTTEVIAARNFCLPVFKAFFTTTLVNPVTKKVEGEITREFAQEDAHEFLTGMLKNLGDEDILPTKKGTNKILTVMADTPINHIFYSIWASKITSKDCPTTIKKEPFTSIEVEIEQFGGAKQYSSLDECLKEYTVIEYLTGSNKFKCDALGGKYVDATKQFVMLQPPNYLIINLKRFLFDIFSGLPIKLDHPVSFPLTHFDMSPYCDDSIKHTHPTYDLIGLVQHSGVAGGGHYTSFVKHKNNWYLCDDTTIQLTSDKQMAAIAQQGIWSFFHPYILFYKLRESTIDKQIVYRKNLSSLTSQLAALFRQLMLTS